MTPKEKAIELVDKFSVVGLQQRNEGLACALIAVDEILHYSKAHGFIGLTKFYEEVKQEIEKL